MQQLHVVFYNVIMPKTFKHVWLFTNHKNTNEWNIFVLITLPTISIENIWIKNWLKMIAMYIFWNAHVMFNSLMFHSVSKYGNVLTMPTKISSRNIYEIVEKNLQ
jgi:hypothetical protein